jgi:ABC-type long-subunit fatty acid transport system fused permease/ATPase subunit
MHVSFDISMIFENNHYRISRVFFLFLKINVFLFFYFYITCVFLFTINNPRIGAHKLKYCVVECTNRVKSEKSKISGPQTWWMVRVCQLIFVHKFQSCHFSHMLPFYVGSYPFSSQIYTTHALSFLTSSN